MSDGLPVGPYRVLALDDGTAVPYYIVPFDKNGRCDGPETRAHLVDAVRGGGFTDIFLFSHGWNNDWTVATTRYEEFLRGYMGMRRTHQLPTATPYRPLLAGVFWPSTALTFGASEQGPEIAAADPRVNDEAVGEERAAVREIAEQIPDAEIDRFYSLAQKDGLTNHEALELARIVRPLYATGSDELQEDNVPAADEAIVGAWRALSPRPDSLDDFGTIGAAAAGAAVAAGGVGAVLQALDPRQIVRVLTVRLMKDRAGVVGTRGVGPLVRDLMDADQARQAPARLHLIGHSYGAKVMLSAVAAGDAPSRPVHTLLLLQPAVSHLCFADVVPKTTRPGGYRAVLDRVKPPVVSTFSAKDFPLTKVFHLALTRSDDLGEARIAGNDPPSVYAALGGFGPRRAGETILDIKDVNQAYDFSGGARIIGLRGTRTIAGHGDISNESTWWALYSLASR